jgi:hypothetical protein
MRIARTDLPQKKKPLATFLLVLDTSTWLYYPGTLFFVLMVFRASLKNILALEISKLFVSNRVALICWARSIKKVRAIIFHDIDWWSNCALSYILISSWGSAFVFCNGVLGRYPYKFHSLIRVFNSPLQREKGTDQRGIEAHRITIAV